MAVLSRLKNESVLVGYFGSDLNIALTFARNSFVMSVE